MKQKTTIQKCYRLADSQIANEIEPVVYADYQITPNDINLTETRYSVIIRGIEIDITSEVRYELNKVCNRAKREQVFNTIIDDLPQEDIHAALQNEEIIPLENNEQ